MRDLNPAPTLHFAPRSTLPFFLAAMMVLSVAGVSLIGNSFEPPDETISTAAPEASPNPARAPRYESVRNPRQSRQRMWIFMHDLFVGPSGTAASR